MVTCQACRKVAVLLFMLVSFFAVSVLAFADYTPRSVCYKEDANNIQDCTQDQMHNLLHHKTAKNALCATVRKDPMISVLKYTIHAHFMAKHVKTFWQSILCSQASTSTELSTTTVTEFVLHTDNNDIYHIWWIVIIGISLFMTCYDHNPFVFLTPVLIILYAIFLRMITANVSDQCELEVVEVQLGFKTNELVAALYLLSMAVTICFCRVTAVGTILTVLCIAVCQGFNVIYGNTASSLMFRMCDFFYQYPFHCALGFYVKQLVCTLCIKRNEHMYVRAITIVLIIGAACLEHRHIENERHQKEVQSWGNTVMSFVPQNWTEFQLSFNRKLYEVPVLGATVIAAEKAIHSTGEMTELVPEVTKKAVNRADDGIVLFYRWWIFVTGMAAIAFVVLIGSCVACLRKKFSSDERKQDISQSIVDAAIREWTENTPQQIEHLLLDPNISKEVKVTLIQSMIKQSDTASELVKTAMVEFPNKASAFDTAAEIAKTYVSNYSPAIKLPWNNGATVNQGRGRNSSQGSAGSNARQKSPASRQASQQATMSSPASPPLAKPHLCPHKVVAYANQDGSGASETRTKFLSQNQNVELSPGTHDYKPTDRFRSVMLLIEVYDANKNRVLPNVNGFDPNNKHDTHFVHQITGDWKELGKEGHKVKYDLQTQIIYIMQKPNGLSFAKAFETLTKQCQ